MKFKVTFKDPDTLYDAIKDAAKESVANLEGVSEGEKESLIESRREDLKEKCGKWFEWGEYITVEVDTEAMTCVVVPVKR